MDKMEKCRPDDSIIWATHSWPKTCSQRVLMEGGREGSCSLPNGTVAAPILLLITLSDLDTKIRGMLVRTANDTKLGEITHMMKSRL